MPPVDKEAKIPCPTPQHLQAELEALMAVLELREQEDTWEKMERAIIRFTGVTRGGGYKHLTVFIDGMGKMGVGLKVGACMLSDRGRLSGVATELLQTLAPRLANHFLPLVPIYLPPLVQLLGRPNKVFLKRAEKCLWTIITHCHLSSILLELRKGLSDEAATCRRGCSAGIERALLEWERGIFGEKGVGVVEEALRKVGTDKDPEVRATGKRIWTKFSEIWPERVDEFSGPLTPTIRRYLGVAANGGPSKPPPKVARPIAARPPAAILTASTSSSHATASIPAEPVQHNRVQALGGRAVRPTPAPVSSESEPSAPVPILSESSRARKSPVKSTFPAGPSNPLPAALAHTEPLELTRQRILSSRAPRYPPGILSHASRSVSHMVLSSTADIPTTDSTRNPLSQPSRPNLPTSYSTTALPTDTLSSEAWRPQPQPQPQLAPPDRKFAPPARIVRTMTADDLPPTTPHVLRGAVKSAQAQAGPRRGLGQAQRRVVTAPTPACPPPPEIDYTPLPLPALKASTSVKERIQGMEKRVVGEVEAASVPLPSSPAVERFPSTGQGSPSKGERATDSPMLPRMPAGSARTIGERMDGDLRDEEMPEEADMTISEPQRRDVQVGQEQPVDVEEAVTTEIVRESTNPTDEPPPLATNADAGIAATPVDTPLITPDEIAVPEDPPIETPPTIAPLQGPAPPADLPESATTTKLPPTISASVPAPAEPKSRKPALPPIGPARVRTDKPSSTAATTLPSVAAARVTKPRVPSAETRKPFRPTTKAPVPPAPAAPAASAASAASVPQNARAGSSSAAPISSAREQTVRQSKPPIPTSKPVSTVPKPGAISVKSSTSAPAASKSAVPPITAPRPAGAISNLTKPTAASAHRAAAAPTKTSKPPVASTTATATATVTSAVDLPPIKKEKIKRKAAVPSFRPVTKSASALTTSLAASTTSSVRSSTVKSTSGGRGGKGEIVAKVRVRPEAIALPVSPGENRAEEIPLPPSPVLGEFTGRVKVKSRPSELGSPPELRVEDSGEKVAVGSRKMQAGSPLAEEIPLPASPTALTASSTATSASATPNKTASSQALSVYHDDLLRSLTDASPSAPSPTPIQADQPILLPTSHPQPDQTPHSKASTAPAMSDWMGSDSEEEEEPIESPRPRVVFAMKQRNGPTSGMRKFDTAPHQGEQEEKDLIEFSAPSRSTGSGAENEVKGDMGEVAGKKASEGVTGSPRVVLSQRDANGPIRVEEIL